MMRGRMVHIGAGYLIDAGSVVGIFDLDKTTYGPKTREFLTKAEKSGKVISAGYELPKSFVVCADAVYLSQLASTTLQKRWEEAVKGIKRNKADQGFR